MLSITIFKPPRWWEEKNRYVYDNKTHRRLDFQTWDMFAKFLYKLYQRPLKGKQDAELISPAVFEPNTPRRNKHVTHWAGWAALDVDDVDVKGNLENVLRDRFGDWECVVYSTASSTQDHPKFRVIFRTSRNIESSEIKHFWFALNSEFDSVGDKQVKDLARMYYVPAAYHDRFNFYYRFSGDVVDVSALLAKWPYEERKGRNIFDGLPDEWKQQILEHKKSSLNNTSYRWSSHHDCPFWPKKLAAEYMTISQTGWYAKMYQIMVATAGAAINKGYPITPNEIVDLCHQFDAENGKWYENRPMDVEAVNAIEYALNNATIKE